ncbi:GNAT family N-acetyltransferase [Ktedonobacter racemifer]|uniref:GCN5-related N-acetyltransferase n=1 Tax=Ktedonobacter racemifer DSM 44963 TaxID=485913 RepID=D6TGY5_KTERA|nr:GNAT family N-acetyltransferase [Ktedonobacter racemifer]EFH88914.1 GCN5-related N-acetyltransferase [Ktedonobacter racemifer DSM 44963]
MENFTVRPMNRENALIVQSWRYEGPYAVYNWTEDSKAALCEMLNQHSPYYSVHDEQEEIVGFFCFGTSAQPWISKSASLKDCDGIIDIGLGMRPNLIGRGYGLSFASTGVSFAQTSFSIETLRLFVRSFNTRARHVYAQAGFMPIKIFLLSNIEHPDKFLEMRWHL